MVRDKRALCIASKWPLLYGFAGINFGWAGKEYMSVKHVPCILDLNVCWNTDQSSFSSNGMHGLSSNTQRFAALHASFININSGSPTSEVCQTLALQSVIRYCKECNAAMHMLCPMLGQHITCWTPDAESSFPILQEWIAIDFHLKLRHASKRGQG